MVTRWLGTWPASRAKTCTWLSGFFALAGSGGLAPDSAPNPSRTMLTTCSWVKGFAGIMPGVVAPPWRAAFRSGGFTPPWRGKLAATSARADLKVGATIFCCAQAGRAKANAIARVRKVSVLRNLMATSRGSRGLREIDGVIIPKIGKHRAEDPQSKENFNAERTETTEKNIPGCGGRDYGSLFVDPQFFSACTP